MLQCGNKMYVLCFVLFLKNIFFLKKNQELTWFINVYFHFICDKYVVKVLSRLLANRDGKPQVFNCILISSSFTQVCLSPLSGALRATSTPFRSPSTAWATTAKIWPSALPTWRSTIQRRRETAGPAQPPGVCQKAAAWAVSMTSPGLPPCVSSALKVRDFLVWDFLWAQMASGQGAYLPLTVAVTQGGSTHSYTLRRGW